MSVSSIAAHLSALSHESRSLLVSCTDVNLRRLMPLMLHMPQLSTTRSASVLGSLAA